MMFAEYMFNDLRLSASRVSAQVSALRWKLLVRRGDLQAFESIQQAELRKGLYNQIPHKEVESSQRVPTTLEMVLHSRHHGRI
jgi:hypothetical protein